MMQKTVDMLQVVNERELTLQEIAISNVIEKTENESVLYSNDGIVIACTRTHVKNENNSPSIVKVYKGDQLVNEYTPAREIDLIKNLMRMLYIKRQLHNRYDMLSCIDYPKEYGMMDTMYEIVQIAATDLKREVEKNKMYMNINLKNLILSIEDIVSEHVVTYLEIDKYKIEILDIQDYFENVVCKNMSKDNLTIATSLYSWLEGQKEQGHWLDVNHLINERDLIVSCKYYSFLLKGNKPIN